MTLDTPSTRSQCAWVLAVLKAGRVLTPIDALNEYGCFRLAARVHDLRNAGYPINRTWGTNGVKRWAEYRLLKEEDDDKVELA